MSGVSARSLVTCDEVLVVERAIDEVQFDRLELELVGVCGFEIEINVHIQRRIEFFDKDFRTLGVGLSQRNLQIEQLGLAPFEKVFGNLEIESGLFQKEKRGADLGELQLERNARVDVENFNGFFGYTGTHSLRSTE